jgi:hypothetical protein
MAVWWQSGKATFPLTAPLFDNLMTRINTRARGEAAADETEGPSKINILGLDTARPSQHSGGLESSSRRGEKLRKKGHSA